MFLTREEEGMLRGEQGEAVRLAMTILVEMGEVYGASRMIPITQAHIDGCSYSATGDAGLEFAELLASLGAKVRVPTTLNITARDIDAWSEFRIPPEHAAKCAAMEAAYLKMGCIPTWTCAPYQYGLVPRFGEAVAWAESNAINYANSVLGARTNRHGDLVDICGAITGRVPEFGLYLDENRRGQVLIRFKGITESILKDDSLYSSAGYLVGKIARDRVAVIEGLPGGTPDNLKAFSAAAASSGAIGLFHIVGVTPEAPSVEAAFGGAPPEEVVVLGLGDLEATAKTLSTAFSTTGFRRRESYGIPVDLVVIGCPHASYSEVVSILRALRGRKVSAKTEFWVQSNATVQGLLRRAGLDRALVDAGVKLLLDGCILNFPLTGWGFGVILTNSGKMAHYAPGHTGAKVILGGVRTCVEAAVTGLFERASDGGGAEQ
ncbi:MAG TPA: DUF521 domain-containing protein [Clostridia bacterium]|nr:DUF521 domain-containing protein [Clostridia bacterium]